MIQRRTRDYEVSLWSLQDSLIAILKQYGLEFKGQIEEGKLTDKDDGTQIFSFKIPMYYYKDGEKIENPSWYNVTSGKLIANMRKVKVIFNKDDLQNRKIYEFLIVKVSEQHNDDNSLYCSVECEGLAFHELGKIGYKISLSPEDFYNDDYDYATNNKWIDSTGKQRSDKPLATLNYWNDRVFSTINNWSYEIQMNWDAYSLQHQVKDGVLADYVVENDKTEFTQKRQPNKVYEEDFIDSWDLVDNKLEPMHVTYAREKARVSVDIKESNIYNITQTLAETFGVFCRYEYQYNQNCQIIKRKVVYYNNFLNEAQGTIDISYPYQTSSIKRNIDSTDLVTKLFVKSVDDPNSGALSIIDVGANDMGEDYILNFDYLHEIGGITDEQYAAVEEYKVKIKRLNQEIAPVSAKVISLQSQLVKLEAELTTRKNAIIQDTEQLLSNTALLDAITNGNDILTINQDNPQLATLIQDVTDTQNTTYYVKITQQGVYPETIKLYRTYSYNNHALQDPLLTGEVVFDDAGEVIRVRKLWLDPTKPKLKTVYITYSYRPTLYYERVVNMWRDRQHTDQIQRDILINQIAQIKYSLYGEDQVSQEELKNMDVTNLFDLKIYDKYQNLLQEKQNTIKQFNAMMGPALREGYWQPENYNDYGDQYNDRFNISLSSIPDQGSTGNTVFKWDDELFEGEQDVFYRISAAEYKQAYPCIDLTTPNGKQILKLITTSKTPISYVYQPRTAENDLIGLNGSPQINAPTSLVYIPNLWVKENNEWKMKSVDNTWLDSLYQYYYDGKLECSITSSTWKYGYSFFSYYKNDTKTPILQYTINSEDHTHQTIYSSDWENKIVLLGDPQENTSPSAQLRLDENDGTFNLIFEAVNKSGDSTTRSTQRSISVRPVTTKYLITQDNTIKNQTVLTNQTKSFNLTYTIQPENAYYSDLRTNLYTWHILHNNEIIEEIPYIYNLNICAPPLHLDKTPLLEYYKFQVY